MSESIETWKRVGERLRDARGRLSMRQAAARAGFSATQWRDMEHGQRHGGLPLNVKDGNLEAAAVAVGLDPAELFDLLGRHYDVDDARRAEALRQQPATLEDVHDLDRRVTQLEERLAAIDAGRPVKATAERHLRAAYTGVPDDDPGPRQSRPSPPPGHDPEFDEA